jgi:phosphoribosylformylglycinamidine (FGAM) synthase PurS component
LDDADADFAEKTLTTACEKLLANPVVEKYTIDVS